VISDGRSIGRDGNSIRGRARHDPENAHIPLVDWLRWNTWHAP